jgi:hypothetical protein
MPVQKRIDIDLADANLAGFASNVTGDAFTITTTATSDGLAHQVSIRNDSANDHSGKTVTLVGTDADGMPQTEVVTGPGASATVESSKYFKTLTSATPSATIGADTFDLGWVDEAVSKTIMLNRHAGFGAMLQIDVTGTLDATVQVSGGRRSEYTGQDSWPWIATTNTNFVGLTADKVGDIEPQMNAMRILLNSYSSGAELQAYVSEEQRF